MSMLITCLAATLALQARNFTTGTVEDLLTIEKAFSQLESGTYQLTLEGTLRDGQLNLAHTVKILIQAPKSFDANITVRGVLPSAEKIITRSFRIASDGRRVVVIDLDKKIYGTTTAQEFVDSPVASAALGPFFDVILAKKRRPRRTDKPSTPAELEAFIAQINQAKGLFNVERSTDKNNTTVCYNLALGPQSSVPVLSFYVDSATSKPTALMVSHSFDGFAWRQDFNKLSPVAPPETFTVRPDRSFRRVDGLPYQFDLAEKSLR